MTFTNRDLNLSSCRCYNTRAATRACGIKGVGSSAGAIPPTWLWCGDLPRSTHNSKHINILATHTIPHYTITRLASAHIPANSWEPVLTLLILPANSWEPVLTLLILPANSWNLFCHNLPSSWLWGGPDSRQSQVQSSCTPPPPPPPRYRKSLC